MLIDSTILISVDIITLSDTRTTIKFYLYNNITLRFEKWPKAYMSFNGIILSVYMINMTYGAGQLPDLHVVSQDEDGSTYLYRYSQQQTLVFQEESKLPIQPGFQPFIGDINNDGYADIIFNDANSKRQLSLSPSYIPSSFSVISMTDSHCIPYDDKKIISSPHSISFLDLNADCMADLFITTIDIETGLSYFEIWINQNGQYCMVNMTMVENQYSQVSFADISIYNIRSRWRIRHAVLYISRRHNDLYQSNTSIY